MTHGDESSESNAYRDKVGFHWVHWVIGRSRVTTSRIVVYTSGNTKIMIVQRHVEE